MIVMYSKSTKVIALFMSLTLLVTNYSGLSVAAVETTTADSSNSETTAETENQTDGFVSRFPGNKDDKKNNESSKDGEEDDDANWVEHKDDDRHGLGTSSGTVSNGTGRKGEATGPQTVKLCDGTWYWYHQSRQGCEWGMNADGSLNLGATRLSPRSDDLTSMGCGLWSTSMILSNLYGRPICIDEMLTQMGATVNGSVIQVPSGAHYMVTCEGNDDQFGEAVAEAWNLDCDAWTGGRTSEECKAAVDACLDAGGMIRFRYGAPADTVSSSAWPYFGTAGHFITIRNRTDDGKYLILDSCFSFCTDMELSTKRADTPLEWDKIFQHSQWSSSKGIRPYGFICFTPKDGAKSDPVKSPDGNTDSSSTGDSLDSGCTWYGPGTEIDQYKEKKDLGDGFYLYDGLPWAADANTYTVDTDTALNDWFKYCEEKSGEKLKYGDGSEASAKNVIENSNRVQEKDTVTVNMLSDIIKDSGGGKYYDVDGLKAVQVCVPPMVVDTSFNINFNEDNAKPEKQNWTNSDVAQASKYNLTKMKMSVVLYEKSTKKLWFLPATTCDEMEKTYPGGIAKTNKTVSDADTVYSSINSSKNGKAVADYISTVAEFRDLPDSVKEIIGSTTDYAVCGYVVWGGNE